jgi:L-seryl-tRNA(Ser) seleniumtransferase
VADVLARVGVRRIVNAKGPSTRLSGGPMRPEVAAAMAEAAGLCVDMLELHAAASRRLAELTGAEAGLVTAGAAAALLLGAAACATGLDPAAMARLPAIAGGRDRVVMVRSQRNQYDHAVRTAGLAIVEVGLPDRFAGAGCRDAEAWEIEAAIDARTACVLWVADPRARPALPEVVSVARARGVPVLVDAAGQLPPKGNLRRFLEQGADLVAFSGGKAIGGPQASGLLLGRRDLVAAAALQMLDMDYPPGLFRPDPAFLPWERSAGLPPHGIGRPCKVGKEQVVGLLVALEAFLAEDEATRRAPWLEAVAELARGLTGLPGLALEPRPDLPVPELALRLEPGRARLDARGLLEALAAGEPAIHPDPEELEEGRIVLRPSCLLPGDVAAILARLRALLSPPAA